MKRKLCIGAVAVVLLAIGGCIAIDYADALGEEDSYTIPPGHQPYLVTVKTPEGLKQVVVLKGPDGKCWYWGADGKLKPVQGGEK